MAAEPLAAATGRRKSSTAHVRVFPGQGNITINGLSALDYLKRETLVMIVEVPLEITETKSEYDIVAQAKGGGLSGQAGAVRRCRPCSRVRERWHWCRSSTVAGR